MPSLNWQITSSVYIADQRGLDYLLINQETGEWAISNLAGVAALQHGDEQEPIPSEFERLVAPAERPTCRAAATEPLVLIYKLTDKCNYRCSYCYDRVVARPKDAPRRSAAVRAMLDRLLPQRPVMLLFHGGEPLLEFDEITALIEDYHEYPPGRLLFSLQTNASRLDQEKLDFLLEHRVGLSISLDGHTPRLNRLRMINRRPDPYELLMAKLTELRGLRADRLGLLLTVGAHNVDELTESLIAFQRDGFRSVSFSFMQSVAPDIACATPEQLTAAVVSIVQAIVDGRIDELACMTVIQWVRRISLGRSGHTCLSSPCGAGSSVATILANGDVGPCDSVYSDAFFRADVDEYFRALVESPGLRDLRARSVDSIPACSVCDVRRHCNGTCAGSAVLEAGKLDAVDEHECAFQYQMIRELLWILCDPTAGPRLRDYCERHITAKRVHGY